MPTTKLATHNMSYISHTTKINEWASNLSRMFADCLHDLVGDEGRGHGVNENGRIILSEMDHIV